MSEGSVHAGFLDLDIDFEGTGSGEDLEDEDSASESKGPDSHSLESRAMSKSGLTAPSSMKNNWYSEKLG